MNYVKEICCCNDSFFVEQMIKKLDNIEEEEIKDYMRIRYLHLINILENSSKNSSFWYFSLSGIITIGTILTSSLITVQDRSKNDDSIYWAVWTISLTVTISNAIIKMLSLDKTYISRNIRLNQFKSEGSMYLTKTGVYNIEDSAERFKLFVSNVEKLKREMTLNEYLQNEHQNTEGRRTPVPLTSIRIDNMETSEL